MNNCQWITLVHTPGILGLCIVKVKKQLEALQPAGRCRRRSSGCGAPEHPALGQRCRSLPPTLRDRGTLNSSSGWRDGQSYSVSMCLMMLSAILCISFMVISSSPWLLSSWISMPVFSTNLPATGQNFRFLPTLLKTEYHKLLKVLDNEKRRIRTVQLQ